MKRFLTALLLLSWVFPVFADVLFYKSNEFGMLLQPIEPYRRDESRWTLEVKTAGQDEVRRLLDHGKESRRWEVSWTEDGARKVERELVAGVLSARRFYDSAGTMIQEEQFDNGTLAQKTLLTYAGGRLAHVRVQSPDGSLIYAEQYVYASNGTLRAVKRSGTEGETRTSSFVFGPSGVSEERTSSKDTLFISRYDTRGRLASRERRKDDTTLSREDFSYKADTDVPVKSTETLPVEGRIIERLYDAAGKLASETSTVKAADTEVDTYTRNDKGALTARGRRSPRGMELWKYSLDEKGKVKREEYFLLGSLQKVTVYGEGKLRTEEIYKDEELYLKVYFDGDTRLKEEVYSGGKLLRERKVD
jgi:antitoxin component YwqK of YwqJK toxin-antitoxin module